MAHPWFPFTVHVNVAEHFESTIGPHDGCVQPSEKIEIKFCTFLTNHRAVCNVQSLVIKQPLKIAIISIDYLHLQ